MIHSTFSFAEWVETLISDPENALTPDEAVVAFGAVQKRQTFINCDIKSGDGAWHNLADRGRRNQYYDVTELHSHCTRYDAQVITVPINNQGVRSVNCNDIGRTVGVIMNHCTRSNNRVGGQAVIPQGSVSLNLQVPLI
ncbi:hypothetical protein BCR34DRAFT_597053 [Clohesyomyces aquaticus]|uniref:Uncharacterized protein n=1 Tax=Clohesyomyces aquaticus TaxID=1231657 RepID=A0A1Y2A403_9PLEO|nr:hypothetical protein BCR34DRAFT_597053 [Clohesyomyces aquaticus]